MNDEIILSGWLCVHDIPVADDAVNRGVLFLHGQREPIATLVERYAKGAPVGLSWVVTEERVSHEQAAALPILDLYGVADVEIRSKRFAYSEVTPDLYYEHANTFLLGGHDLNAELLPHVGKWVTIMLRMGSVPTERVLVKKYVKKSPAREP